VTQEKWKQRRSVLRRFLVYIWLITFAPVASLVIQPYACEGNISAVRPVLLSFLVSGSGNRLWVVCVGYLV
jgi:hypothetical protein